MANKNGQGTAANLWRFASLYRGKYILAVCLSVLGVAAGLVPYYAAAQMLIGLIGDERIFSFYIFWGMVAGVGYLAKATLAILSTSVSHTATFFALRDLRKQMVDKFYRMPMGQFLDTPSGQLKDTLVDRVEGLETPLAHLLPEMSANVLVPIFIVIYLFVLDWRMALISLITIPVGMAFMATILKTYPQQYEGSVKINQRMNSAVVEYVNGIEVIKAFNQSAASYGKYSDAVRDNAAYFYNWMKSCQWAMAAYNVICPAVLLTVLPAGVLFYAAGSITAANLITIIILSLGIVGPLIAASNFADSLGMVGTVVDEIAALLDGPELDRPSQPVALNSQEIRLNDVSFSYKADGDNAIRHINLTIEPGTVTALVGPSGSGKSTIAKLIAGFWDVGSGAITIDGKDLRRIPQHQLAAQIAYVSQDNYLFDTTIRENIRMGRLCASDAEVEAVAKAAGCDAFIRSLEHGYDTHVGGAGGHLSGGERQRIAIARAMLKDSPIVILDEATAYIDPENEAVVQQAVSKLVAGKTLIIIAHRLSTITDSDRIVVMKDGAISAMGSHDELLKTSTLYKEMWQAHIGAKDGEKI
ncbi:MAG: ABC transporter ATP-binding protein [Peptococcaceae bacterium]|nr:ABC transporter ATP-binding protein [Peptococcaceae bacterium]